MKHTQDDLKKMQTWSLQKKIQVSQTRIMEWYNFYDGRVYVSFSGGKDSTVLLDLCRRVYPDIEAVFVDTGLEYPEIRDFVKKHDNVTWLKPKMNFKDVIKKYGYPVVSKEQSQIIYEIRNTKSEKLRNKRLYGDEKGTSGMIAKKHKYLLDAPFKISGKCCNVMKKAPIYAYETKSKKHSYVGVMADESRLRKQSWLKNGCNAFDNIHPQSSPLSFWTEQDILRYLKITGLEYASVYGDIIPSAEHDGQIAIDGCQTKLKMSKAQRTGCMFCMYGVHMEKGENRFQRMRSTDPEKYDFCIREDNGLGLGKILDFMGVKYE